MFKFEDVKLVQLPEKILREKSQDIEIPLSKENIDLIEKMIFHVSDSQKPNTKFRPAVGVAAIQYGIPKNIFYILIVDANDKVIFNDALINPKLVGHSNHKLALSEGEGCLSVNESWPNQEGYVPRYSRVIVDAYSYMEKKFKRYEVSGYTAIVFQHEYDHLQGNLFIDRINKKNPWGKDKELEVL
ncbi:peptide deformylase [Mycoplasmopsis arginini]|uniref:Peptide deformylase n=1 Tax=Mycoplasmopsis arginini TaxID=2094 RepID=A0A0C6G2F0_MYCAR|nr:peptide deformylase [Mycoplasmopsis arginini]ENY69876.1 Peptide deformylase (Polypeptide deformylase) [Mycoplasmopsis arginini 7264]MCY2903049.1 peptide deformylase [Mycoplasmopsis arginini QMP CG1-2758]MDI3348251.1 peptide deformylase [Mycoplasmopsis arginini]MDI3348889.1 peptide deformylase [Mycoplasmopsis arginini]MDI3349760.1 peptide deformylase [Mycoplasmopsis arginini]